MVRNPDNKSKFLRELLEDVQIKLFHHAAFDIKHLIWWMNLELEWSDTIVCTKALCKMARPKKSSSLHKVIPELLKVHPYKEMKTTLSNWNLKQLSAEQITYACTDVMFLSDIANELEDRINDLGIAEDYIDDVMTAIVKGATTEVRGYADCLSYDGIPNEKLRKLWLKRKKMFLLEETDGVQ